MKELKKNEGITLIALIITIIVLLILAAVTLSMIFGENGIINKANTAKEATTYSQEKELVNLGYLEWKTDSWDKTNKDEVKLKVGQKGETDITGDATNGWTVTFTATGHVYEVDPDTGLKDGTSGGNDLQKILETATKPEGQTESDDVGIDSRGQVVNLDYWEYYIFDYTEYGGERWLGVSDDGSGSYDNVYLGTSDENTVLYPPAYIKFHDTGEIMPVTQLGGHTAFADLVAKEVVIPETVTKCGEGVFSRCKIDTVKVINCGITKLEYDAFANSEIKTLVIGDSVTEIEEGAFVGCETLENLTLGNGITSIPDYMFGNCTSLKNVTLGNKITTIGNGALGGGKYTSVRIPSSVINMGWSVFDNCENLTDIYVEGKSSAPSTWDENWLEGCSATVHWNQ